MNEFRSKITAYIILAAIIVAGVIASSYIVTTSFVKIKGGSNIITVTGSAKKQITSDLIVWTGSFSAKSATLTDAYKSLEQNKSKVQSYLNGQGLTEEIVFSSIITNIHYILGPYGQYTSDIESYELIQNVTLTS
ncbi:MAG: SIMPL domain-containing protein, partial [Paludibacteraceae bacterium]